MKGETEHETDLRRGRLMGLTGGLLLGVPAGLALKIAGYPSDELYTWLTVLGIGYAAVLIAALILAPQRKELAAGLVLGATGGMALAPALVILDIGANSQ